MVGPSGRWYPWIWSVAVVRTLNVSVARTRRALSRQGGLWRAAGHPDAGGALSTDSLRMGNGTTWPFSVLYRVVSGDTAEKVVPTGSSGPLPDFIDAAKDLVRLGAEAITPDCGFLSLF